MNGQPHRIRATGRAFTLIEMMIVIALIGILVALVVGVGGAVQGKAAELETRAVLKAIQGAIETYTDTYGSPPAQAVDWTTSDGENLRNETGTTPSGHIRGLRANTGVLVAQLRRDNKARQQLEELSKDLFVTSRFSPDPVDDPDAMVELTYILDPFGTEVDYQANGGVGGTPVLISAGPNRLWGDGDDVRSDDQ